MSPFKLLKPVKDFSERFWKKVDRRSSEECWSWLGTKRAGYGLFKLSNRHQQATRVAYQLTHGPMSKSLSLDHLCRNTWCVNPNHLEPVSHRENVLRGIGPTAINAKKTECIHGHPLSGSNLYRNPTNGGRFCKTCLAASKKKYDEKKRREVRCG